MTYYLSSKNMTVLAITDEDGIIIDTANITKCFVGQPIANLINWMGKQGGFYYNKID